MSASTHDTTPVHAVPSIPKQILRATLGTFSVLLALALVGGVIASRDTIEVRLWRVVGDPNVVLADGLTLSDQPQDVVVPQTARRSWAPAEDVVRIEAVTGKPVRLLTAAQASAMTGSAWPSSTDGGLRGYATPLGVVVINDPFRPTETDTTIPGQVSLYGTAAAPRQATTAEQVALFQKLVDSWGAGASPAVPGTHAVVDAAGLPGQPQGAYGARVATAGASTSYASVGSAFWPATSGQLAVAHVILVAVRATPTVRVVSPASAFDQLRHHADTTAGDAQTVSATRLEVGDYFGINTDEFALWTFLDATGRQTGSAQARG